MSLATRKLTQNSAFGFLIAATVIVVVPVLVIIGIIIFNGAGAINWTFLSQAPSQAGKAGGMENSHATGLFSKNSPAWRQM